MTLPAAGGSRRFCMVPLMQAPTAADADAPADLNKKAAATEGMDGEGRGLSTSARAAGTHTILRKNKVYAI